MLLDQAAERLEHPRSHARQHGIIVHDENQRGPRSGIGQRFPRVTAYSLPAGLTGSSFNKRTPKSGQSTTLAGQRMT